MITQAELDSFLEGTTLENYDSVVLDLIQSLGTTPIERSKPISWNVSNQHFWKTTDSNLSKEQEISYAKRLEFLKKRLDAFPTCENRRNEWHSLRCEMVERFLFLVPANAGSFDKSKKADLFQEGSIALFRAVDKYDWRKGFRFSSYAGFWIKEAFRQFLYANRSLVRLPIYIQKAIPKVNKAKETLDDQHADANQVSKVCEIDVQTIESVLNAKICVSTDSTSSNDNKQNHAFEITAKEQEPEVDYTSLFEAMKSLGEREKMILNHRYGIGTDREYTLTEIAEKLNLSLERVRQIQYRALEKLKSPNLEKMYTV